MGKPLNPQEAKTMENSGLLGHYGILKPFSTEYMDAGLDIQDAIATMQLLAQQLLIAHEANIDNPHYTCEDPTTLKWLEWAKGVRNKEG